MNKFLTTTLAGLLLISTVDAGGRSYSAGSSTGRSSGTSGRSYSGGQPKQSAQPKQSGKSYSGELPKQSVQPKQSGKSYSGGSEPSKSSKSTYDAAAIHEYKTEDSRKAYKATFNKGEAPKSEYKTSKGETVKIDPKDKKIDSLRKNLDHQKWVNRELREREFYHSYYGRPTLFPTGIVYHDPYNDFFFMWLWSQSMETRAMWMYNHQASMDQSRYNALLAKDTQLEARVRQLEAGKTVRDVNYTPNGIDTDLMYTDSYVDAVYNPQTKHADKSNLGWFCFITFAILCLGAVVYFVFYYKY